MSGLHLIQICPLNSKNRTGKCVESSRTQLLCELSDFDQIW